MDNDDQEERCVRVFTGLFSAAKESDEFEYACALIRIRGVEGPGWDTLEEIITMFSEMLPLMAAPLERTARVRLALLVYNHLVEADPIYWVIENLLRTMEGFRCSVYPFQDLYRKPKKSQFGLGTPPSAKTVLKFLCEHARRLNQTDLAALAESVFNDGVRNAFSHSDYTIYRDEFRTREGNFQGKPGRGWDSMKLSELEALINRTLLFFQSFMRVYNDSRLSYREAKIVQGRIGPKDTYIPVRLLADESGLLGFESISG
jgi:hypothetical protein